MGKFTKLVSSVIQTHFRLTPQLLFQPQHCTSFQRKEWLLWNVTVKEDVSRTCGRVMIFRDKKTKAGHSRKEKGKSDGKMWKHTDGQTWKMGFSLGQVIETGYLQLAIILGMFWPLRCHWKWHKSIPDLGQNTCKILYPPFLLPSTRSEAEGWQGEPGHWEWRSHKLKAAWVSERSHINHGYSLIKDISIGRSEQEINIH